jgi:hypothetical protein
LLWMATCNEVNPSCEHIDVIIYFLRYKRAETSLLHQSSVTFKTTFEG